MVGKALEKIHPAFSSLVRHGRGALAARGSANIRKVARLRERQSRKTPERFCSAGVHVSADGRNRQHSPWTKQHGGVSPKQLLVGSRSNSLECFAEKSADFLVPRCSRRTLRAVTALLAEMPGGIVLPMRSIFAKCAVESIAFDRVFARHRFRVDDAIRAPFPLHWRFPYSSAELELRLDRGVSQNQTREPGEAVFRRGSEKGKNHRELAGCRNGR